MLTRNLYTFQGLTTDVRGVLVRQKKSTLRQYPTLPGVYGVQDIFSKINK